MSSDPAENLFKVIDERRDELMALAARSLLYGTA
jgi:hypothetical protein